MLVDKIFIRYENHDKCSSTYLPTKGYHNTYVSNGNLTYFEAEFKYEKLMTIMKRQINDLFSNNEKYYMYFYLHSRGKIDCKLTTNESEAVELNEVGEVLTIDISKLSKQK